MTTSFKHVAGTVCFAFALAAALTVPSLPAAAVTEPAPLLPTRSCGPGWRLDGKVTIFKRETLSDRINGEAELFFPYGFESLAYGRYANGKRAIDVDVYRMGSPLDAFGIYANYRPEGGGRVKTGTEGVVTTSQLFFYQDRYFVRLQSTGHPETGKVPLAACAVAVSRLLPSSAAPPTEPGMLAVPGVDAGSVQYHAASLLGYDFFRRGLIADAPSAGESARVFLVLEDSPAAATRAFEAYRAYLHKEGTVTSITGGAPALTGMDPLYGKVRVEQDGSFLVGAIKLADYEAATSLLAAVKRKLPQPVPPL